MERSSPHELVPARSAICLECRAALREGERCDADPGHRVVSLRSRQGRWALIHEVWGRVERVARLPLQERLSRRHAGGMSATDTVAGALFVVGLISLLTGLAFNQPLLLGATLLCFAGGRLMLRPQSSLQRITRTAFGFTAEREIPPRGVAAERQLPPRALIGVVRGEHSLVGPISGTACVAFGLTLKTAGASGLRPPEGSRILLRDSVTTGFDVVLDDGEEVRVAAGRLRIEGAAEWGYPPEDAQLDAYLVGLDPLRASEDHHFDDPFKFDLAEEILIRADEVVEILGTVEPAEDRRAESGSLRDARRRVLVPAGTAIVRIVDPAPPELPLRQRLRE